VIVVVVSAAGFGILNVKPYWNHFGGETMPTITLKNIPEELYERIKKRAKEHRRSINSEVIVNLERGFLKRVRISEEILADVDRLREKTVDMSPLTDEEIRKAKDWGRP